MKIIITFLLHYIKLRQLPYFYGNSFNTKQEMFDKNLSNHPVLAHTSKVENAYL